MTNSLDRPSKYSLITPSSFYKNNFIRTRASDFLKIKNILETNEPQKRNEIKNSEPQLLILKNNLLI